MSKKKKCTHIWGYCDLGYDGCVIADDKETIENYLKLDKDYTYEFDYCPYCGDKLND